MNEASQAPGSMVTNLGGRSLERGKPWGSGEGSRLGLLTKLGIRGVIEERPASPAVIPGMSAGRIRASSSSVTSRLGLLTKLGINGVIEERPAIPAVIPGRSAGRTLASSSW